MSDPFYRAFEDVHRGSRDLIRARLHAYDPFIDALRRIYPGAPALDLGCGRGEWLELLQEAGFAAKGVDLDEGMLSACRERGLPVEQGDALAALEALPECSQALVGAIHVVEHIPFDALRRLIAEALRVLKPGGLLILETPNPENLQVATANFYLDPYHLRPLPPPLLQFVVDQAGFARSKVTRLQESPDLAAATDVTLRDVLAGVSPDYAVIAQKEGQPEHMELMAPAFDRPFGLSLDVLAERYEQRLRRLDEARESLERIEAQLAAQQELLSAQQEQLAAQQEQLAAQTERARALGEQLQAVHRSFSWRLTAPLRWPGLLLDSLVRTGLRHASLRRAGGMALRWFPDLRNWLIHRALGRERLAGAVAGRPESAERG